MQKYVLKILLRNSKNWMRKKKFNLKSDQNCNVQENVRIGVFSDALYSESFVKTSIAFISKLHFENGSLDFPGIT